MTILCKDSLHFQAELLEAKTANSTIQTTGKEVSTFNLRFINLTDDEAITNEIAKLNNLSLEENHV